MLELNGIFPYLDRLVQWIVIPLALFIYGHSRKHVEHEKKFIEQQGEIRAVLAVLEAYKAQRIEDQANQGKAIDRLTVAVEKLNDRLDRASPGQH
jgi:hypothetical protein